MWQIDSLTHTHSLTLTHCFMMLMVLQLSSIKAVFHLSENVSRIKT